MNKPLKERTNHELLKELLERVEYQSISFFAELLIMFGRLSVEQPDLYQQITKEMQKKLNEN